MIVTHAITMDLVRLGAEPQICVMQNDSNTRQLQITMLAASTPWQPGDGITASVAYRKPGGTKGWYDTLPDGSAACIIQENTVSATLAPQMLTSAGRLDAAVVFMDADLNRIATFPLCIQVQADPAAGGTVSNDYYNYSTLEDINAQFVHLEAELFAASSRLSQLDASASIVSDASGTEISLADASDRAPVGLKVYGKTTQLTTTGKNLATAQSVYAGANSYQEVAVDGRNCVKFLANNNVQNTPFTFKENTQYIVSFYAKTVPVLSANTSAENAFCFYYTDGTYSMLNIEHEQGWTLLKRLSDANKTVSAIGLWGFNYVSNVYVDVDTFQIEEGATATAYEPYTGGIASPNPDYPQALESPGASGSIGVNIAGKNLLAPDMITQNGLTALRVNEITLYAGIPYVFSSSEAATALSIREASDFSTVLKTVYTSNACKYTPTTTKKVTLDAYWASNVPSGATIQLEIGDAATEYAEGKPTQTLTISTPNGLPGIPVVSGGNYTDETGQAWICDEIDLARGVYVQRIFDYFCTGTETAWTTSFNEGCYTLYDYYKQYLPKVLKQTGLCSHFQVRQTGASASPPWFRVYENAVDFNLDGTNTDLDGFKARLAEQYTNGTPVTVRMAFEPPIETPISAEELAAYAALHTVKPNTTVYNDANAHMELSYVADTKTYIDNKFNELAAALVNNT